jgi:hypothetical protein
MKKQTGSLSEIDFTLPRKMFQDDIETLKYSR